MFRTLLRHGADVFRADHYGKTPLWAMSLSNLPSSKKDEMMRALLDAKVELTGRWMDMNDLLTFIALIEDNDLRKRAFQKCLDQGFEAQKFPGILAWFANNENCTAEEIVQLLDLGASKDTNDGLGSSSIHLAIRKGNLAILEQLLLSGVDYTIVDEWGENVMHEAARHGTKKMYRILAEHGLAGVDLDARDILYKETPAEYFERYRASCSERTREAFYDLLDAVEQSNERARDTELVTSSENPAADDGLSGDDDRGFVAEWPNDNCFAAHARWCFNVW